MKIVIAGGTGLLGRTLTPALLSAGHEVVVLTRGINERTPAGTRAVTWQPDGSTGEWAREIDGADAVVNLAGAGIADKRWTTARKHVLQSSRVLSTRSLAAAVREAQRKPAVFLQGSAVGFYGASDSAAELDESFPPGDDFLGDLGVAWEAEAHPIASTGTRLVFLRSGVVLSRDGGAVPKMRLPFLFFAGGPMGHGRQYMSWIHRDDWVAIVLWALGTPSVHGVLNATSPGPVTNAEFSTALGSALRRPNWIPVPGFALRLIVGPMANEALLKGQRVVPARPLALGFTFKHPEIGEALEDVLHT